MVHPVSNIGWASPRIISLEPLQCNTANTSKADARTIQWLREKIVSLTTDLNAALARANAAEARALAAEEALAIAQATTTTRSPLAPLSSNVVRHTVAGKHTRRDEAEEEGGEQRKRQEREQREDEEEAKGEGTTSVAQGAEVRCSSTHIQRPAWTDGISPSSRSSGGNKRGPRREEGGGAP